MSQKSLKTLLYKKETSFGEAYDNSATFNELKVSDITVNRVSTKLETKFLNADRELNNTTSTGIVTGKASTSKPLDASFLNNHLDLVESGFGELVQAYSVGEVVSAINGTTITVADGSAYAVGDQIAVGVAGSNFYTGINEIVSINSNDLVMKYPISLEQQAQVTVGTDTAIKVPVFSPAKTKDTTFQFVCIYSDDTIEVLRGAKASLSFSIPQKGKVDTKIEILSASIASETDAGVPLVKPNGTVNLEGDYNTIFINFINTFVYDAITSAQKKVCPYKFDLKVDHKLTPEELECGLNNIGGYYSKPDITSTIEVGRNEANLLTFSRLHEANDNNFLYLSQGNLALIAEKARFTNLDLGYTGEFDNIKLNVDVNFSTSKRFLVAFPH